MQIVNLKTLERKQWPLIVAFVLLVIGTLTGPVAAQEPQWEIMLPDVLGPIAVDPTDSDVIYVAASSGASGYTDYKSGMLKSTDGGQTWDYYEFLSEGLNMGSPEHILINPDNPDEIRVSGGPFVGVLLSTDGGQTWEKAHYGIPTDHHGYLIKQLAYDRSNGMYYMADWGGGAYAGLRRSEDGKVWQLVEEAPVGNYLCVLVDESHGKIFAGINSSFISLTRGSSENEEWENVSDSIPPVWHLAQVPGSRTLYAGTTFGIYKSYNGAESWVSVNDSLTEQLRFIGGGLAVSQTDTNTVFAAGRASSRSEYSSGIFISRNGGNSWSRMNFEIPDSKRAHPRFLYLDDQTNTLFVSVALIYTPNQYNIYRLDIANVIGTSISNEDETELPQSIRLYQNYPNPFNPMTVIEYALPEPAEVTLRIYDVMGRLVETLVDQSKAPGKHQATWDASNAASGVYIYRIQVGDFIQSRQMLLIK